MIKTEKGEMQAKSPLHEAYEEVLGNEVDARTMRRIRNQYLRGKANLRAVKTLALLRKANGNMPIGLEDIEQYYGLLDFAEGIEGWVKGDDLLESLKRMKPCPCPKTIDNWGKEIGVRLRKEEWYSPEQVQAWIRKIARQRRFKFPQQQGA